MNKNSSSLLKSQTDWERLENMKDEDIDLSDIPEITPEQFAKAKPTKEFFAERGIHFDPTGPHTVTIHHEDGTTETYELPPRSGSVYLAPDVQEYFPDSTAVNNALRTLISLFPAERSQSEKLEAKS